MTTPPAPLPQPEASDTPPAPLPQAEEPGTPPALTPPESPGPVAAAPSPGRPAWLLPVATGVAGLVLGAALMAGITTIRAGAAEAALLTDAVEACGASFARGIDLGDEGRSLTFDMKGEDEPSGADILDIACIFGELDMPSAVMSHIDQTTSMDGRQTETWENITVSWSYHPDRGLDGVLTVGEN